jgi:hypothetical protein
MLNLLYSLTYKKYQKRVYSNIIGFFKYAQQFYVVLAIGYKKFMYLPFYYFKKEFSYVFKNTNNIIFQNIYSLTSCYKYFNAVNLNEKSRFFKFFSYVSFTRTKELTKLNSVSLLNILKKKNIFFTYFYEKKKIKNLTVFYSAFSYFIANENNLKTKFVKNFVLNLIIFRLNSYLRLINFLFIKKSILYLSFFIKKYFLNLKKKKWITSNWQK